MCTIDITFQIPQEEIGEALVRVPTLKDGNSLLVATPLVANTFETWAENPAKSRPQKHRYPTL